MSDTTEHRSNNTRQQNTLEGFRQVMIEQRICHPQEFVGMNDAEVDEWVSHFEGTVHSDYRDFLKLCGKFAGKYRSPVAGEYLYQIDFDVLLKNSLSRTKHKEGGPYLVFETYLSDYDAYYILDGSQQVYAEQRGPRMSGKRTEFDNIWAYLMPGIVDPRASRELSEWPPDFGEEDYVSGEESEYDDEKDYRPYVFLGIDPTKPWIFDGDKWMKE